MSVAKRKPRPDLIPSEARRDPIPSLRERASALLEELLEAPAEEKREILTGWRDMLDAALSDLAETRRFHGKEMVGATGQIEIVGSIPAGWIKMQMDARGHGNCPCRAMMIEALKADA